MPNEALESDVTAHDKSKACAVHTYMNVCLLTSVHDVIPLRSMDQDDVIIVFFHVISIILKQIRQI